MRSVSGACLVCAVLAGAGLTGRAARQASATSDVTLARRDGTQLRVPSTGPLASPVAQEIAREIAAYDKQPIRPSAGADPAVVEAMRQLAKDSRDDAVDQLDSTLRVAQSTSGALDSRLLRAARQSADTLKQIARSPPPPSLRVRTEISSSIPNAVLHYCLRADYRKKACSWQSYSLGAVLHIGLYMFKVQSDADGGQEREEQVLVLNEPTKVTILPMR